MMKRIGYLFMACLTVVSGSALADCDEVGYIATFEVTEGQEQSFESAIVKVAAKVMTLLRHRLALRR